MNVTDGQTDRHRMTAYAALMHSIARQKSSDFDEILYTAAYFELDERHVALASNEKVALDRLGVRQNVFLVVEENPTLLFLIKAQTHHICHSKFIRPKE